MAKKTDHTKEVLLGIDFGKTNIGTALGRNGFVAPLDVIPAKNIENAIGMINRFIVENNVNKVIVGLPLSYDNKETALSLEVRKSAKLLKAYTKRPVDFQNEYGSSKEALGDAIDLDVPQNKRRNNDHLAAALILKSYYEENDLS